MNSDSMQVREKSNACTKILEKRSVPEGHVNRYGDKSCFWLLMYQFLYIFLIKWRCG